MILQNLNQLALEAQNNLDSYHKEEILLSSEFKKEFSNILTTKSSDKIKFSKYSSVIETSSGLTITFPNQWFFIASYFANYLIALKEYKKQYNIIFQALPNASEIIKQLKSSPEIPPAVIQRIENNFNNQQDIDFFKKFLTEYSWWFGSKTIDRGDYYVSPVLSLAKVVNVSQSYISDLASYLSESPVLIDSLKGSVVIEEITENDLEDKSAEKIIEENESIRDFAFNVFSHFYGENWAKLIEQTTSKPASINTTNYVSHDLDVFTRLIGEFQVPQTKETLTSANTQRFFEEPIYRNKDKFYFFTNQWTGTTGDLSFESLKSYFETNYPEYKFEKTEKVYKLLKVNEITDIPFSYKSFHAKTKDAGLKFTEKIVSRFVASLCTKPFVICSGLSGSGKTKLAQSFVKWICKNEEQYKIVPVGADWTNREPLLGFPNGLESDKYVFPDSGVLQLIINASKAENKNKPFFLILDEMNLSHVERYFADFLSIMESQDNIKLYSGTDRLGPDKIKIDNEISWPKNLFIIGTVNIDETTYMFSPKVLDRANVIEFRISESEITNYLSLPANLDMSRFINQGSKQGYGAAMAKDFLDKTKENANSTIPTQNTLVLFFNQLRKCGAEFGYRSASEINRLISILDTLTKDNMKWDEKDISVDDFIDIAIMQKLLPKLHGSRNKLTKILPVLGTLCLTNPEKIKEDYFDKVDSVKYLEDTNIKYKLSFEKICRMYKNAIENGYASYAEA